MRFHWKSALIAGVVLFVVLFVYRAVRSDECTTKEAVCPARPLNCTIDERRNIRCLREKGEVFLPFSFVKRQMAYDVDGRLVGENTSRMHFDYRTPGIKTKRPNISAYDPFGVFANFGTFTVERRTKVGCVSGEFQLPMSVQWAPTPYFYPIQIGQFGLQHFSQMFNETIGKVMLVRNDRLFSADPNGLLPLVHSDVLEVAETSVIARMHPDSNLPILLFDWRPQTAASSLLLVVFDQAERRNITLKYAFSEDDRCVWTEKADKSKHFVYSLGRFEDNPEFRRVIRDFKVDVLKALLVEKEHVENKGKHQYQLLEVRFDGPSKVKLPLKQQTHAHREQFLLAADWFVDHADERGGWRVPVVRKWSEKLQLKANWTSAMGQGHGLSVLTRAFKLTNDQRYLTAATSALGPFEKESMDGGVRAHLFGYAWYEEYPTNPPSLVLNGFIYSLLGLHDFSQLRTESSGRAKRLFDAGIESLKALLPLFDTGSGSIYDLKHVTMRTPPNLARGDYHDTHIYLLKLLHVITGDSQFKTFSDRWFAYSVGQRAKHN